MEVHKYNKRTGNIDKIKNIGSIHANKVFEAQCRLILNDPFHEYYRVTLYDPMRKTEVKDSDGPIFTMDINLGLR